MPRSRSRSPEHTHKKRHSRRQSSSGSEEETRKKSKKHDKGKSKHHKASEKEERRPLALGMQTRSKSLIFIKLLIWRDEKRAEKDTLGIKNSQNRAKTILK